jgi:hypothetical protein
MSGPVRKLGDKSGRLLEYDNIFRAPISITVPHHEIHEGNGYVVQEGIQLNNASKEYLIVTPDTTKWTHMIINVLGSQDTSVRFVEGTGKTGGTALTEINRNRNSNNTAGVVVTHTPAGAEGGVTVLFTAQFGIATASGGRGGAGAQAEGRAEFILKQNNSYSLTVTALSANVNNITVDIDWYEHTSG